MAGGSVEVLILAPDERRVLFADHISVTALAKDSIKGKIATESRLVAEHLAEDVRVWSCREFQTRPRG